MTDQEQRLWELEKSHSAVGAKVDRAILDIGKVDSAIRELSGTLSKFKEDVASRVAEGEVTCHEKITEADKGAHKRMNGIERKLWWTVGVIAAAGALMGFILKGMP